MGFRLASVGVPAPKVEIPCERALLAVGILDDPAPERHRFKRQNDHGAHGRTPCNQVANQGRLTLPSFS
jgi:hypothetical protein